MQIVSSGSSLSITESLSTQSSSGGLQSRQAKEAVETINQSEILGYDRVLKYTRDFKSNMDVIDVLNRTTGEKITQIPSELAISLAEALQIRK